MGSRHNVHRRELEHGIGKILAKFTVDPARGSQPKKQNTPGL
ncbi:hypothetical protein [Arthrobacter sp. OAP107]